MQFSCDEQLSGFCELDFYLLSETSNWPIIVTDLNAAQIIFTVEDVDIVAEIDDETIQVNVNERKRDLFDITISFQFKTRSESLDQLLDQYKNKPGVALGKLMNGFQKLYGTNEEPLYLSFEVDDAVKPEDKGATKVQIKGQTRRRTMYYTPYDSE